MPEPKVVNISNASNFSVMLNNRISLNIAEALDKEEKRLNKEKETKVAKQKAIIVKKLDTNKITHKEATKQLRILSAKVTKRNIIEAALIKHLKIK